MRALLVLAHPRGDSLTAQTADRARGRLEAEGYEVDLLDLYAEDFDPRLGPADEPSWGDRDKEYSPEVRAHMRRIDAADTLVVVFPVWWYGPPAILKGWIDRVWNYGFAYGRSKPRLAGKRMLWLALAGESREGFAGRDLEGVVDRQLLLGVSRYCGIEDSAFHLAHESIGDGAGALASTEEALAGFLAGRAAGAAGAVPGLSPVPGV